MNKTIKIGACDFWTPPLDLKNSFFNDIIEMCGYTPIIDNYNPDILFYSVFGNNHLRYTKPIKIWFSGENWGLPNFNECNFALSGYYVEDQRHFRCPLYVKYARNYIKQNIYMKSYDDLSKPRDINKIKPKTKFCNFIYRNSNLGREGVKFREDFFKKLSKYKKVDATGSNKNIDCDVPYKVPFMEDYKFSIAMENSNQFNGVYGYTTEKILDPMLANSVPIYWGNPYINKEFNTKSFINYHDYNDVDKMIEHIIEIDNNDELYQQYLSEPFVLNHENSPLNLNKLISFFKENILNGN